MVGCLSRVAPESVADDICFRNFLNGVSGSEQHISACDERVDSFGREVQHFFVERHLQVKEILSQPLPSFPAKDGNWREHFSAWCVGRQAAAVSSGVKEDSLFLLQPLCERNVGGFCPMG